MIVGLLFCAEKPSRPRVTGVYYKASFLRELQLSLFLLFYDYYAAFRQSQKRGALHEAYTGRCAKTAVDCVSQCSQYD